MDRLSSTSPRSDGHMPAAAVAAGSAEGANRTFEESKRVFSELVRSMLSQLSIENSAPAAAAAASPRNDAPRYCSPSKRAATERCGARSPRHHVRESAHRADQALANTPGIVEGDVPNTYKMPGLQFVDRLDNPTRTAHATFVVDAVSSDPLADLELVVRRYVAAQRTFAENPIFSNNPGLIRDTAYRYDAKIGSLAQAYFNQGVQDNPRRMVPGSKLPPLRAKPIAEDRLQVVMDLFERCGLKCELAAISEPGGNNSQTRLGFHFPNPSLPN